MVSKSVEIEAFSGKPGNQVRMDRKKQLVSIIYPRCP
jgi:hypothetical protein